MPCIGKTHQYKKKKQKPEASLTLDITLAPSLLYFFHVPEDSLLDTRATYPPPLQAELNTAWSTGTRVGQYPASPFLPLAETAIVFAPQQGKLTCYYRHHKVFIQGAI